MKPIEIVGLVVLMDRGKKGMKKQIISMEKYQEFLALYDATKEEDTIGNVKDWHFPLDVLFAPRAARPPEDKGYSRNIRKK